jgi:hypothetical protein
LVATPDVHCLHNEEPFQLNNNFMLSSKVRLTDSPVLPGLC